MRFDGGLEGGFLIVLLFTVSLPVFVAATKPRLGGRVQVPCVGACLQTSCSILSRGTGPRRFAFSSFHHSSTTSSSPAARSIPSQRSVRISLRSTRNQTLEQARLLQEIHKK